jgi:phage FluMu protein Com
VSYQEAGKRVEIGCKRCGRWFWVFPNNHLRGKGCKICAQQDRGKRESEEYSTDVIGRFRIVHGEKYDYSNVVCKNAIQEVEIRCLTCNSVFLQRPSCHLRGDGCKKCADRMNGENRKNAEKEEVLGKFYKVHGDRYDYSNVAYDGDDVKVSIKCKKCNHMFLQTPSHHKLGNGCPRCNESSGEILVSKILESSDIKFERQKAISGCCYRRRLLFDFYFSMNGHEFAIEYNGIQHYRPVSIFGGEAGFLQTTCRDEIKRRFCKEKGIRLIEIPYTENSLGKISKTLREQVGITGESLT